MALEQKMAAIHFNTEKFRLQVEARIDARRIGGTLTSALVGGGRAPDVLQEGAWLGFGIGGQGEASVSPPAMRFAVPEGHDEARTVDGVVYTYKPSVAPFDGHRPWVAKKQARPTDVLGTTSEGLTGAVPPGIDTGSFAKLIELLGKAQSIEEVGPGVAGAQPVTVFVARLDLADVVGGKQVVNGLEKLAKGGVVTARLELMIAASGLPQSATAFLEGPGFSESVTSETLALEVPVSVQAPPAREVISAKRLKRLERRRVVCVRVPGPARSRPHGSRAHSSRAQRKRRRRNGHHGKRARSHRICMHGASGSGSSEPETETTVFG